MRLLGQAGKKALWEPGREQGRPLRETWRPRQAAPLASGSAGRTITGVQTGAASGVSRVEHREAQS